MEKPLKHQRRLGLAKHMFLCVSLADWYDCAKCFCWVWGLIMQYPNSEVIILFMLRLLVEAKILSNKYLSRDM